MKFGKIALASMLALGSNWAAAQANLDVTVNVTVSPCAVSLDDASALTVTKSIAEVLSAPDDNQNIVNSFQGQAPTAHVLSRATNIRVNCAVAQRVYMQFADTHNQAGSFATAYQLRSGADNIGAYNFNFAGSPVADGAAVQTHYSWGSTWEPATNLRFTTGGGIRYGFFNSATGSSPVAVTSLAVPVSIDVGISKALAQAKAASGSFTVSGAATISVTSY
jgi:hypothetical protein